MKRKKKETSDYSHHTSPELMKVFHILMGNKPVNTNEVEAVKAEFRKRDLEKVNKSLRG